LGGRTFAFPSGAGKRRPHLFIFHPIMGILDK
jgi:hypothetical protein